MNPGLHGHENVLQIVKITDGTFIKSTEKCLWLMRLMDIGYFGDSRKLDSQLKIEAYCRVFGVYICKRNLQASIDKEDCVLIAVM